MHFALANLNDKLPFSEEFTNRPLPRVASDNIILYNKGEQDVLIAQGRKF